MRRSLERHPDSRCEGVQGLAVEASRDGSGRLSLRYVLTGKVGALAIPATGAVRRADRLWEHTCFEAFVAEPGQGYLEFNFAPSGQWAAYRFDGHRRGMAPLQIAAPRIELEKGEDGLELCVSLRVSEPRPLRLGLTAVIEEVGGRLSYWALAHPPGPPDFHDAAGFALPL